MLYATSAAGTPDVQVVCVSPPVVVLGQRMVSDSLSRLEMRFLLARAAELVRPERIVALGQHPGEVAALLAAIVRTFGKGDARADDERLRTTLPVKVRTQLEKLGSGQGRGGHRTAVSTTDCGGGQRDRGGDELATGNLGHQSDLSSRCDEWA